MESSCQKHHTHVFSMNFRETKLPGVFEVLLEEKRDDRGFFARTWCEQEFRELGLNPRVVQCSISFNERKGTLRGIHYQARPYGEAKLVRCTKGSLYDVALDLRPDSPTYLQWTAAVLTADNHRALYIPEGCAHGLLTLEDDTEAFYQISEFFHPEAARGVRWNDPAFEIKWPGTIEVISDRDRTHPDFEPK
jgi:dTDP-4-dehydrorhamnose 3,5-epimerase